MTISALPRSVGDRRHTVCVLSAGGDIVIEETIVNTRECLQAFSARFPTATIVMETGTHSPWVSRRFEARGHGDRSVADRGDARIEPSLNPSALSHRPAIYAQPTRGFTWRGNFPSVRAMPSFTALFS